MPDASEIAKNLSEKSNQELTAVLENLDDWRPEAIEFARAELTRRGLTVNSIEQRIVAEAQQKVEQFNQNAHLPLTFWESFFAIIYGVIGLIGLIFVASQTSRFKSEGFLLKSKTTWNIWAIVFCIKVFISILCVWYYTHH